MNTFLITLIVVGVVMAAMAVGVMFGRKPIAGSCGGVGADGGACGCSNPCSGRQTRTDAAEAGQHH